MRQLNFAVGGPKFIGSFASNAKRIVVDNAVFRLSVT